MDAEVSKMIDDKYKEMENSLDFVDFEGNNCEECAGWDGLSDRCECGNRRVYWEYDKTTKSLNAVAY